MTFTRAYGIMKVMKKRFDEIVVGTQFEWRNQTWIKKTGNYPADETNNDNGYAVADGHVQWEYFAAEVEVVIG